MTSLTIKGTITEIETVQNRVKEMKKITVSFNDKEAYIDVTKNLLITLKHFKKGDKVLIDGFLKGNKSNISGKKHNNIIALSIIKTN